MAKYDIVTKEILKQIARDLSRYILKIPVSDDIELIEKEFTRVEKRDADLLFKSGNSVIHIEIQNQNHSNMHKRMLRYYSDILFEYEEFDIKQFIIYIGRDKCNMKSQINRDSINYKYGIIDMRDLSCKEFLESNEPALVSLSILCDFENEDSQVVVNTILKRLKTLCKDELEFRSHLKMVEILSSNRDLEDAVKKGEEMLKVDIQKMPSYQIGLEKGVLKGIEKGIKKGIEKGKYEARVNIAKEALKHGLDIEMVMKLTNLSKDEIINIQKTL